MALDLILGKITRDWSCGNVPLYSTAKSRREMADDSRALSEVGPLAALIEQEVQQNFQTIAKLHASGRMPPDRRKAFGSLMRRWIAFKEQRHGRYESSDYVELTNFRDENRRRTAELAAIDRGSPPPRPEPQAPCGDCSARHALSAKLLKEVACAAGIFVTGYLATNYLSTRRTPKRIS